MPTEIGELPDWAHELLDEARVGRIGLLDDRDRPRVLPVTFAVHEGRIWSAVDRKPKRDEGRELARIRFLRRRPEVAFTVDRYDDDWSRLAWVQALGTADVVAASGAVAPIERLAAKYEPYRSDPPPGPLIGIEPERILCWQAVEDGRN